MFLCISSKSPQSGGNLQHIFAHSDILNHNVQNLTLKRSLLSNIEYTGIRENTVPYLICWSFPCLLLDPISTFPLFDSASQETTLPDSFNNWLLGKLFSQWEALVETGRGGEGEARPPCWDDASTAPMALQRPQLPFCWAAFLLSSSCWLALVSGLGNTTFYRCPSSPRGVGPPPAALISGVLQHLIVPSPGQQISYIKFLLLRGLEWFCFPGWILIWRSKFWRDFFKNNIG